MFFSEQRHEVYIKSGRKIKVSEESEIILPFFTGISIKFQPIIFLQLSKKAREFLLDLITERDIKTNKTVIVIRDPALKSVMSKAYSELKQNSIAVRVQKQTYLLNPDAIIPQKDYYENVRQEWLNYGN